MPDGELSPTADVGVQAGSRGAAPDGALAEVVRLLSPRLLAARNRYRRLDRNGRLRLAAFGGLGLAFGVGIYLLFHRVLTYFRSVEGFGDVLTYKLLGMIFVTFFSILLFSNVVTSLSSFFLARELDRIAAAPVSRRRFFYARLTETVIDSSWMLALFSVPAFLAYGVVHKAGPLFYVMTAATLPPFLVIPAASSIVITALLVNVFPARRTRDILLLLSLMAVALLYLLFRMLRPERLVNPESFSDFMVFLAAMRTPDAAYLPTTWATEILAPLLGLREGTPFFHYGLLLSTAAVTAMASEAVLNALFLSGWSKAQEGRQAKLTQRPLWERALSVVTRPFAPQMRLLMIKEIKTFFRDTSQWSQLILLLALVVVYIYNFSVLPYGDNPLVSFYFKNAISFLNLALAGFVIASVSVRFVFPSFSLEGKSLWVLKSAPLALRRLWWAKYCVNIVPLVVLGEILVVATNTFLHVMPFMMWLSSITLFGMTITVVALGLAVGAAYPKFDADNAAQVAAGMGGLIYMILCISFIGAVVVLEAWPVYAIFVSRFRGTPLPIATLLGIAVSFALVAALHVIVLAESIRRGLRRLEAIEP
jgi:ABC-2 type transport system permease protein